MAERQGLVARTPVGDLRWSAAILAAVVAAIHLFHPAYGAPQLIAFVRMGTLFHPLPALFTLSALIIVFGLVLAYQKLLPPVAYLLGAVLMMTFVVGYVAWHTVLDHGAFWPYLDGHAHTEGPVEQLVLHVSRDALGAASKVLETLLAVVLLTLYHLETSAGAETD